MEEWFRCESVATLVKGCGVLLRRLVLERCGGSEEQKD
jgi:hypothetical protein